MRLQLAVIVGQLGDAAVQVACAFFGAYLVVTSALKLASSWAPAPYGASLLAFGSFKPQLSLALSSTTVDTLLGSPYIYGPALALLLLTLLGAWSQARQLKAAQGASDMEALIRK